MRLCCVVPYLGLYILYVSFYFRSLSLSISALEVSSEKPIPSAVSSYCCLPVRLLLHSLFLGEVGHWRTTMGMNPLWLNPADVSFQVCLILCRTLVIWRLSFECIAMYVLQPCMRRTCHLASRNNVWFLLVHGGIKCRTFLSYC